VITNGFIAYGVDISSPARTFCAGSFAQDSGHTERSAAYELEVYGRTVRPHLPAYGRNSDAQVSKIILTSIHRRRTTAIVSSSTVSVGRPGEYWIANAHVASRTERRRTTFFHRLAFGGVHRRPQIRTQDAHVNHSRRYAGFHRQEAGSTGEGPVRSDRLRAPILELCTIAKDKSVRCLRLGGH
jgi:hypothetical protein